MYTASRISTSGDEGFIHQPSNSGLAHSTLLPPGLLESQYDGPMDYPPPGLVRAMAPVIISEEEYRRERLGRQHVIDNSQVSLFSDFAQYFDSEFDMYGNRIFIDLTCGICGDCKLEVPSRVTPHRSPEETCQAESMSVLPCGHFFGSRCLDRWISTCKNEEKYGDCPLCRFPLYYEDCSHDIRIRPFDPRFHRINQLAHTIPEGGVVPAHCKSCRVDWIRHLAERMVETVYPRDVPESSFKDFSRCGPDQFRNGRASLRRDIFERFLVGEEAIHHW
ncbi:hypothetical protein F4804DRAFT_347121 [Jackrogersella minutella]|nr:hypothetical protein F4804DRAFT_347121 [Jackrogersella minutella]